MSAEEIAKLNLWQRLSGAQSEAKGVSKRGQAPAAMGGFNFVTDTDVADAVRQLLGKWGIVHLVKMVECNTTEAGRTTTNKEIYRADVRVIIHLINVDRPSEREVVEWWGRGDDTADKSIGKAGTSAVKNAWIKILNLQGDPELDPDQVDATGGEGRFTGPKTAPRPKPAPKPQPAPVTNGRLDKLRDEIKSMLAEIPPDRRPSREEMAQANKGESGPENLHKMIKKIWQQTADVPRPLPPILVGCPRCDDRVPTTDMQKHLKDHHSGDLGPVLEPELIEEGI